MTKPTQILEAVAFNNATAVARELCTEIGIAELHLEKISQIQAEDLISKDTLDLASRRLNEAINTAKLLLLNKKRSEDLINLLMAHMELEGVNISTQKLFLYK